MTDSPSPVPLISVVSPVFGAPDLVSELVRRLVAVLEKITPSFEIVLVNDACPRDSWPEILKAAAAEPRVRGINLSRNFGQHIAITAGLDHAQGEWVVVMDCDLQDQPEEIPRLYAKAREGFDTVFGRRCRRQDSKLKVLRGDICTWIYDFFTGLDTDRAVANFSISHRKVIDAVRQYRERDRSFPGLVLLTGFRRTTIDIDHAARPSGKTSYTWLKLTKFALQVLVSGTNRPLYASIKFGLFLAAGSLVYAISRLIQFSVTGVAVPGWTTLAFLVSFFSGLLFMQLGVIGLYLGKVFDESKRRPLYHVAETLPPSRPS
ncbi:MAG: glycosyltransferase family 2 protein [Kiritimatiellia bacterium]